VLLADPTNRQAAIEVEALSGSRVTVALAQREAILHFLDRAFPNSKGSTQRPASADGLARAAEDLTGVSQVFALLLGAARDRASELYLDPSPKGVLVRIRVDGRLLDRAWFDRELLAPLTFRLRLLAGLRGESTPRTARLRTRLDGRDTELEFLFYPTLCGEATAMRFHRVVTEAPTLEMLDASESTQELLAAFVGGAGPAGGPGGMVLVAGVDAGARVQVLYALARAAACADGGAPRRVLTIERRTAFVVPGFLQVELPADFEAEAATVLSQSADVNLVEDIMPPPLAAAALAGAERGTLVLAGLGLGSVRSALAYLGSVDLRGPMLALTRGVVVAQQSGGRLTAEALALTPALRRDLIERKDPWTSASS
jgi:type II secretory ATPase GspE/PulE/Tfp pilus assembly ATPase PilB-like protein